MLRLVTKEDIQANPELSKKGVSVNQYYDFPETDDEDFNEEDVDDGSKKPAKKAAPKKKK